MFRLTSLACFKLFYGFSDAQKNFDNCQLSDNKIKIFVSD